MVQTKRDYELDAVRLRVLKHDPADERHGLTGYRYGCRCLRCKAGKRTYGRWAKARAEQRRAHEQFERDLQTRHPYVDPFAFDEHRDEWEDRESDQSFRFFLNNIKPQHLSRDEMWLYIQAKAGVVGAEQQHDEGKVA